MPVPRLTASCLDKAAAEAFMLIPGNPQGVAHGAILVDWGTPFPGQMCWKMEFWNVTKQECWGGRPACRDSERSHGGIPDTNYPIPLPNGDTQIILGRAYLDSMAPWMDPDGRDDWQIRMWFYDGAFSSSSGLYRGTCGGTEIAYEESNVFSCTDFPGHSAYGTGDTFWSGAQVNNEKLYLQSGQFTGTVVTSVAVSGMVHPSGIEWDGAGNIYDPAEGNTLWTDRGVGDASDNKNKLFMQSGVLTTTLKNSQSVGLNAVIRGITSISDRSATPWAGYESGTNSKLYLQSGQFTSTLKVSLNVSSVDLRCNDVTWAGFGGLFPATTGDTFWSGSNGNRLYANSGLFSSTIKDSQDLSNKDNTNTGVSWAGSQRLGGGTLWTGAEHNKLMLMSGRFTGTLKTSQYIGDINNSPTGISTHNIDGRLGSPDAGYYSATGVLNVGSTTASGSGHYVGGPPVGGEKIYLTNYAATASDTLIYKMDLNGSNLETVLTGPGNARDIVTDAGASKMFWTEISGNSGGTLPGSVNDSIFSADLDGGNKTELADVQGGLNMRDADELVAKVTALAVDKVNQRIFFIVRSTLAAPQNDPVWGQSYDFRLSCFVVNYDGTYNGQSGPTRLIKGNPLIRNTNYQTPGSEEPIPSRMKYVEPSSKFPDGRLFYLTHGDNDEGSEVLYIDLNRIVVDQDFSQQPDPPEAGSSQTMDCLYSEDCIRSFDVDTVNNSIYLGRHAGTGEDPPTHHSRLERVDFVNDDFIWSGQDPYIDWRDNYLLQDYGATSPPNSASGDVTNTQFKSQIVSAFQEWKELFEDEFSGLTLNFQNVGDETGSPPKSNVFNTASGLYDDDYDYDIPNGTYKGLSYDNVGDLRIGMHTFRDGSGNALAHAWYPFGSSNESLGSSGSTGADLHFDVDENWREDGVIGGGFSILYVAAHEIGHSLGIRHDSDSTALMYPSVSATTDFQDRIGGLAGHTPEALAIRSIYGGETNENTQMLPPWNPWQVLKNAIQRLQDNQSTSETVTFTYSYMQARPETIGEVLYTRHVLNSDCWDIPNDITLDLDGGYIYVGDAGIDQALRFDLDGGNRTELTPINTGGSAFASGLALVTSGDLENLYVGQGDCNTQPAEISGDATYYSPFSSSGSDLEITKISCDGVASFKNAPRLPKFVTSGYGVYTFVGKAKFAEAIIPNLGTSGQGTHINPPSYVRPTDDIFYHNRNDNLVPHHGWNQSEFSNKYDATVTCARVEHVKKPFTPTDLVINDGCNLDKDVDNIVDIPVRNTNMTRRSEGAVVDSGPPGAHEEGFDPGIPSASAASFNNLNASKVAKSVALMNHLNSQGLNAGRKNKLRRSKKKDAP